MLVGNSQTLCDLHRTAAGCAFVPNAFLMEFMIQWYIRWAQTHLKEKVPTMILSAPTVTYLLLFDVRYVIDICVQNIGCGFLLPRCKTAQLPVQLIICHIRCWGRGVRISSTSAGTSNASTIRYEVSKTCASSPHVPNHSI